MTYGAKRDIEKLRDAATNPEAVIPFKMAETFFDQTLNCLAILDHAYNFICANEAFARACRRDISEFVGRNYFDHFPSGLKMIFDEVVRTKRAIVMYNDAFQFACQPLRNTTHWDWSLAPILDRTGEIEYLALSLADVTKRKHAEQALRIAEVVYQDSAEAIMVTDAANNIIAVNSAFTRITGYASNEVLGKHPSMLKSAWHVDESCWTMEQELDTAGHWDGELCERNKKGDTILMRLAIRTVYDDADKVTLRVALISDITEETRKEMLIWKQTNFDELTKLPNRYQFRDRLQQHIEQVGAPLAVLLIDLDEFKEINDNLGYDKGDMLLIEAARRICEDLHESMTIARMGGDEFTVILTEPDDLDNATRIATQIIAKLAMPFQLGVETAFVSASIGIARFPEDGAKTDDLLRHADQAMYAAKKAGRNRFGYFTSAMQDAARSRMRLTNDLRCALAENQFEVHYQPIVELSTGRIRKAEALIRWHHPTRGMVSPAEFIPLAEASGMITEIGEWVVRQSVEQIRRMLALDHLEFQISVNISPLQFRGDCDLNNAWRSHLLTSDLPPKSMVIEITEGLLLDLSTEVTDKLLVLGKIGIQVALDDFGTGYSSLAYLKKFNIDYLKIDRVFVKNLETESDDCALCEAIIVMAHKLGLKVIAEGVETAAQRDFLIAADCDFAQGYLFSKAVPARQFEALLR